MRGPGRATSRALGTRSTRAKPRSRIIARRSGTVASRWSACGSRPTPRSPGRGPVACRDGGRRRHARDRHRRDVECRRRSAPELQSARRRVFERDRRRVRATVGRRCRATGAPRGGGVRRDVDAVLRDVLPLARSRGDARRRRPPDRNRTPQADTRHGAHPRVLRARATQSWRSPGPVSSGSGPRARPSTATKPFPYASSRCSVSWSTASRIRRSRRSSSSVAARPRLTFRASCARWTRHPASKPCPRRFDAPRLSGAAQWNFVPAPVAAASATRAERAVAARNSCAFMEHVLFRRVRVAVPRKIPTTS